MAVRLTLTVTGQKVLADTLEAAKPHPKITSRLLRELALRTQADATTNQIIRGGKRPPVRGRLTSRTGTGRRSISVNLLGLPRFSEVGSDLVYMAVHERGGSVHVPRHSVPEHTRSVAFGRKVAPFTVPTHSRGPYRAHFPRRPWLQPAAEKVTRQAPEIAARITQQEIDRA